jgi:hypothetical protein
LNDTLVENAIKSQLSFFKVTLSKIALNHFVKNCIKSLCRNLI